MYRASLLLLTAWRFAVLILLGHSWHDLFTATRLVPRYEVKVRKAKASKQQRTEPDFSCQDSGSTFKGARAICNVNAGGIERSYIRECTAYMGSAIDLYEQAPWYEYAIQLPGYLHPTSLQAYSSTLFALRASGLGDHITCGGLRCFDSGSLSTASRIATATRN